MALKDSILSISDAFTQNQVIIKLVTAIIILLFGLIIGRIIGRTILKILKEIEFDKTIKKTTGIETSISQILSRVFSWIIYLLAILMALESLGLTPFVLTMVSGILLFIIAVSLLLAIKDYIPNFIAGYSIKRKGLFREGEKIKVGSVQGRIIKINLLETHIETKKKDLIVMPNSYFIKNLVIKIH